jgi:hypothetical protein
MKKQLNKLTNSRLGKIFDYLFLGFEFFLPKFALYLIVPTILILPLGFILTDMKLFELIMKTVTIVLLPITILGFSWFVYRTTGDK